LHHKNKNKLIAMNTTTTKINRIRIFTAAWAIYREKKNYGYNFAICLRMVWNREKMTIKYNAEIAQLSSEVGITDPVLLHKEYNRRRSENAIIGYVVGSGRINYHRVA